MSPKQSSPRTANNEICPVRTAELCKADLDGVGFPAIAECPNRCPGPSKDVEKVRKIGGIIGPFVEVTVDVCGLDGSRRRQIFPNRTS